MTCPTCHLEVAAGDDECPRCGTLLASWTGAQREESPWSRPSSDEPTLAFASPAEYAATHPAPPAAPAPGFAAAGSPPPAWTLPQPPVRKRRLALPVLVLALALLVTGGGVAAAGYYLGWFGGGRGPAEVVPGTAVSYLQVDLDPSLVQKASAWQFLRDLPQVKEAVASGRPDPKAIAWKLLAVPGTPLEDVDYARDVQPWLGDRFAVAAVPRQAGGAGGLFAVQVRDEAKAAAALRDWAGRTGQAWDVTIRDGYALLTEPADTRAFLGQLDAGPLSSNATFTADLATLGDPGVAAGWIDLAAAARLAEDAPAGPVQGRAVVSLGFTADTMTFGGRLIGLGDTGLTGAADLGALPASTWAGLGFADGGSAVEKLFPTMEAYLRDWLTGAGLDEADLAALLGRSFSVGLSSSDTAAEGGMPEVGLRIETDDVARARAALEKLVGPPEGGLPVTSRVEGDVLFAATSAPYLGELASPPATLGTDPAFVKALPDHARASFSLFVNPVPVLRLTGWSGGENAEFVGALRGIGAEYVAEGPGSGSWAFRVVRD